MQKSRRLGPLVAVALACATVSSAQHYRADFPPEELAAGRLQSLPALTEADFAALRAGRR